MGTKTLTQFDKKGDTLVKPERQHRPPTQEGDGVDTFPKGGILRLDIQGSPEPILLAMKKSEIVLGRRDPATGALPDVDLAPYAGYRMGVSRRHSQFRRNDDGHLEVIDLGSSNGTFLNGVRLAPHTPNRLHDKDEVTLGQIVIQVSYKRRSEQEGSAVPAQQQTASSEASASPASQASSEPASASEQKAGEEKQAAQKEPSSNGKSDPGSE